MALEGSNIKRLNESNAVAALLEVMPFLTGCRYLNQGSPDESSSSDKEVDFIMTPETAAAPPVAIEHTKVEAFRGQLEYVNRSYDIVKQLDSRCRSLLPADRYFILVPPHALIKSLRKKSIGDFLEFIKPWVVDAAARLAIDEYETIDFKGYSVMLMCGGSHPEANGTVGRIPGSPEDHLDLAKESLWHAILHGLAKFPKYKAEGYDTVLSLEDISGAVHSSMLLDLHKDEDKKHLIDAMVDFIIVFAANEERMIVGSVWKERHQYFSPSPFNRRFQKFGAAWAPME